MIQESCEDKKKRKFYHTFERGYWKNPTFRGRNSDWWCVEHPEHKPDWATRFVFMLPKLNISLKVYHSESLEGAEMT
jgi:hypothetical protein